MKKINHWINGETVTTEAVRTGAVYDPSTGSQTGEVALASTSDVDLAVRTARHAFETWGTVPLTRRQTIMFAFRELVAKHRERHRQDAHLRARQDPR